MKKILFIFIISASLLFAQNKQVSLKGSVLTLQEIELANMSDLLDIGFDTNSDVLYQVLDGGKSLYYVLKNTPNLRCGSGGTTPNADLQYSRNAFWNENSGSLRNYYNNVVNLSNSFGGWFYFDSQSGGYNGGCTLADRSGANRVFRFTISPTGILSISQQHSDYSTASTSTTQAVPMDEWIYLQGYQMGHSYSVGWKKTNGVQHVVSNTFYPVTTLKPNAYSFNISCASNATHTFWQPGKTMFSWMETADIGTAEICQVIDDDLPMSLDKLTEIVLGISSKSLSLQSNFEMYEIDGYKIVDFRTQNHPLRSIKKQTKE